MKILIHVPVEQYGFVSAEWELDTVKPEIIRKAYRDIADAFKPQPVNGLSNVEFVRVIEEYMETGVIRLGGDYEFNPAQSEVLKIITKIVRNRNK